MTQNQSPDHQNDASTTTSQANEIDSTSQATTPSVNDAQLETNATANSQPNDTATSNTANPSSDNWQPKKRNPALIILFIALIVGGALLALYTWKLPPFTGHTVTTDNAYVRGQTTVISPRVSGYVQEVLVSDFAQVKKGDPLVKIDSSPYEAKVAQAEAGLAAQNANTDKVSQSRHNADANLQARAIAVKNAELQLKIARQSFARIESVKDSEGIAGREYDQAKSAVEQAEMGLAQAQAQYKVAQQDILSVSTGKTSADAGIANAQATVDLAKQELGHTTVYAPADGRLGEVSVKTGQLVSAGTQLMFLVPQKHWVIANVRETDMKNIKIGQRAKVSIDALNGQTFTAKVAQIAPAANAEFSVIRADSGNGNFVKIAQRIAVKLEFDANQNGLENLSPGMSVNAEIDTASNGQ
ncbi:MULTISPECIES: HlyD family secretion protein [unclassified Acinetobacter]|uniref:HlyD family secretion protein n=1 Tax=unclassified Acinetobacter TaxID=196816 RepID=UPI0035BA89B5